tara:strand:- start:4497 stop:6050 length:1554 start_codon:yes stop_codon:yes gene_type:complete
MTLYKKNIRVLLIEPAVQRPTFDRPKPNGNLGPAYIIGALRKHGVEVDYLDATVGQEGRDLKETFYSRTELENGLIRFGMNPKEYYEIFSNYDIIATSSIFSAQTRMHFEIGSIAKKVSKTIGKKILVVSGGVNARALKEHFLSNGFDIVALGDGERTIVQIVDEFSKSKPDFSKVERIAFKENEKIIITSSVKRKPTKFLDDHVPHPAIDAFPLDTYQKLSIPHAGYIPPGTRIAPIMTARGCQDACTFCHVSKDKQERDLYGDIGYLKLFSEQRVAEDVKRAEKLGVTRLYFEDDNLFFNKKRLYKLAAHLQRSGMSYSDANGANLRFMVNKENGKYEVDEDFINMLAGFGMDELLLPFETRSNEMLQKYATGKYDPEKMLPYGIVKTVKKHKISARSNFLIGFRDETWESILATKEFAKNLFAEGVDQAGFAIPVPYPGTLDFDHEMTNKDVKKDFDNNVLKYTDFMHPLLPPLFPTTVPGDKLVKACREFWEELNTPDYVAHADKHQLSITGY